jgi:biopolymer transport protein ExbD
MKLTRKKKLGFLDTAASSDLAFLLIIYFIVIAGFNINTGFLMNLPAKNSTRMIHKDDLIRFNLDKDGLIIYNEELIGIPEARNLIASAQTANPEIAVMLTIDPQARWQRVVSFVEIAQDLRIESFSFTMNKDIQ